MSETLDFYQKQAMACFSNLPWIADLQKNALADFKRLQFPTRKHEEWKYTVLDSFLKQRFSTVIASNDAAHIKPTDVPVACHKIAIVNGVVVQEDVLSANLPAGVLVLPLAQAIVAHEDKVKPYLGQILHHGHGFQALNTAILQCGVFIYLPQGTCLDKPLLLEHWQDASDIASYVRHLVVADAGSSASIIEDYQGERDAAYFTNTITEVHMGVKARLTHYKIQRESKLAYHIGHLAVKQDANSQFDSHSFSFGGKLVRSDITFDLQGDKAHCSMNGIYAPADGQHVDHHTQVLHALPNCSSAQDYKGILSGASRAVFNGKIIVAKDAQQTSAKQQNKNVLLSTRAEVDTKPQLEIFANDVVCTHGATVGQLDEEAIFYLATRGIERADAIAYLIQAFAVENIRVVADTSLATWLGELLNRQIG